MSARLYTKLMTDGVSPFSVIPAAVAAFFDLAGPVKTEPICIMAKRHIGASLEECNVIINLDLRTSLSMIESPNYGRVLSYPAANEVKWLHAYLLGISVLRKGVQPALSHGCRTH